VLAKLLLRNEVTRTDGISRLVQLSTLPEVGGEANKSWRQGLKWVGSPRAAQIPLFEEYLKANPGDVEIRALMNNRGAPAVAARQNPDLVRGFKALQNNQLNVAERAFLARLKEHSQAVDALGGLGVVRQRQGRMNDANDLLTGPD
jgi:hypothetical protein